MSWMSHQFMKSASRGTGLFSWANDIPKVGGIFDYIQGYWDRHAKAKGVGAYAEDKSTMEYKLTSQSLDEDEGGNKFIGYAIIAYIIGLF